MGWWKEYFDDLNPINMPSYKKAEPGDSEVGSFTSGPPGGCMGVGPTSLHVFVDLEKTSDVSLRKSCGGCSGSTGTSHPDLGHLVPLQPVSELGPFCWQ